MHEMVRKWPYLFSFITSLQCSMPFVYCTFRPRPVLSKQLLISAWVLVLIIPFLCNSQILFQLLSHNLWKVEVYDCCFAGRVLGCRTLRIVCVQSLWLLWMHLELVNASPWSQRELTGVWGSCCACSASCSLGGACASACPVPPHPQLHQGLSRQK